MWRRLLVLGLSVLILSGCFSAKEAAASERSESQVPSASMASLDIRKPVIFMVVNQTGNKNLVQDYYQGWKDGIKLTYDGIRYVFRAPEAEAVANLGVERALSGGKVDKNFLAGAAQVLGGKVVILLVPQKLNEELIIGGVTEDSSNHVRTYAMAKMYAYDADGAKYQSREVYKVELSEEGIQEHPQDTIKWALVNLVRKMNGKPAL